MTDRKRAKVPNRGPIVFDDGRDEYSNGHSGDKCEDVQCKEEYANSHDEDEDSNSRSKGENEDNEEDDNEIEKLVETLQYCETEGRLNGQPRWKGRELETRSLRESARLYKCLEYLDNNVGAFAHSASFSNAPNPGLRISDFGMLRLPVSFTKANKLYEFGASNHLGAFSVIPATNLWIRNRLWQTWLDGVVKTVGKAMGIEESMGLSVKLEKLVTFGMSNGVKGHTFNSSDIKRTVGTLEITLPRDFVARESKFRFSYGDDQIYYSFGEQAQFDTTVTACDI
ncbi:hypothetical protein AA313_de0203060 [Arthrobotrys entomopaga]|nr:hypothetical protein AA313_de0203060 [Arthrobotrys entomopaga]